MTLTWPAKDPEEVLDYNIDWSARLAIGDIIVSSDWEVWSGGDALAIDDQDHADTNVTVWLSGGALNRTYELTNRITTAGGRTHEQTVVLPVRAK